MVPAENLTCTRATQTAIAAAAAAAEIAELARSMVAPSPNPGHGGRVQDAQALVAKANQLLLLTVAAERRQGATWREIGDATECSIPEAYARFGGDVEKLDQALVEHWLDTATGGPTRAALPPAAADPVGTARRLDAWVDPAGRAPLSHSLQYLSDGDHAYMISAARQVLDRHRAAGTDPARVQELEYGYLHRSVEGYERMLDNATYSRGRESRMRENLDEVRARIAELDAARASSAGRES